MARRTAPLTALLAASVLVGLVGCLIFGFYLPTILAVMSPVAVYNSFLFLDRYEPSPIGIYAVALTLAIPMFVLTRLIRKPHLRRALRALLSAIIAAPSPLVFPEYVLSLPASTQLIWVFTFRDSAGALINGFLALGSLLSFSLLAYLVQSVMSHLNRGIRAAAPDH